MEDLLRLITSNPILLFLVIGAILSFLQRGKEQERQRETRKPGAPASNEKRQDEIDWREIFRQESQTEPAPRKQPEPVQIQEVSRSNELLERYEKVKRNRDSQKKSELAAKNSPIYKDDITASERIQLDFSNISKEEAVKGVIWSEILGKPRAKGSYRPSLNSRRKIQ